MSRKTVIENTVTTIVFLIIATIIAAIFINCTNNSTNIAIIYMLAVTFVAKYTVGYVPGIIASLVGVICVNYVFTYPYMELNFSIDGYPMTFAGMMIISSTTSTLTTHLKKQNQIINEREKMLMEAEKETMRANLLRAISHDLRTPLTSIIGTGSAYLESSASLSEKEKDAMVSNICEDANWLLNMVENLLSVTRIKDDNMHVNKQEEPLEEVVSEAVMRLRKRLPNARIHVRIPDDFIMIPMDATLIEQVIINLLENAVYHSKSTKPIDFYVDIHNDYAWFHIKDYGTGIREDLLDTIFDGYNTSQNSSSDSHKGMGIGLTICKTIILAHQGEITASNHEEGAEFTFTLPLKEDEETGPDRPLT